MTDIQINNNIEELYNLHKQINKLKLEIQQELVVRSGISDKSSFGIYDNLEYENWESNLWFFPNRPPNIEELMQLIF